MIISINRSEATRAQADWLLQFDCNYSNLVLPSKPQGQICNAALPSSPPLSILTPATLAAAHGFLGSVEFFLRKFASLPNAPAPGDVQAGFEFPGASQYNSVGHHFI